MANMNITKKNKDLKKDTNTKLNHEGDIVHSLNSLEMLFSKVLGSFFGENTYYEEREPMNEIKKLQELISSVEDSDIEYVLKIAEIGRSFNMISYPLNVLSVCFNDERFKGLNFVDSVGRNKLGYYTSHIVKRARDITDVLAVQKTLYTDRSIPMQMRKCLKERLEYFNEYQLSKALGQSREVSMADAIKLIRPKPNCKKRASFYRDVIENNVTFGNGVQQIQVAVSNKGNVSKEENMKAIKDSIMDSSVMALLKNLKSFINSGLLEDVEAVDMVCSVLSNKKKILNSRLLPFRFYSAFKELEKYKNTIFSEHAIEYLDDILCAIAKALDISIETLGDIEGNNVIIMDISGSMGRSISQHSSVTAEDIALLLGAICYKKSSCNGTNRSDVMLFATECMMVEGVSPRNSVITIMKDFKNIIKHVHFGLATNLRKALKMIEDFESPRDNVILFSDGDCYQYSKRHDVLVLGECCYREDHKKITVDDYVSKLIKKGCFKKIFVNNLVGNDFTVVNTESYRKNLISGYSEQIVTLINVYQNLGRTGSSDIRFVIDKIGEFAHTVK